MTGCPVQVVKEWEMETHTMAADNEDSKDNNIPEAKNLSNIYHMLGLVLKALHVRL